MLDNFFSSCVYICRYMVRKIIYLCFDEDKKKFKKISMFGLDIIIIHSFFMIIINFTHIANILTTFFF